MRKSREVASVRFAKPVTWSKSGGSKVSVPCAEEPDGFEIEVGDHWVYCTELYGKRRTFGVHASKVEYVEYAPAKVKAA